MIKILMASAALALGMSAVGAVAQDRVELWNGVYAGESKDQVRARFPTDGKSENSSVNFGGGTQVPYPISDSCDAQVVIRHENKTVGVSAVQIQDLSYKETCADSVLNTLKQKYGEPREVVGPDKITQGDLIWTKGPLEIKYRLYGGRYFVTYLPASTVDAGLL